MNMKCSLVSLMVIVTVLVGINYAFSQEPIEVIVKNYKDWGSGGRAFVPTFDFGFLNISNKPLTSLYVNIYYVMEFANGQQRVFKDISRDIYRYGTRGNRNNSWVEGTPSEGHSNPLLPGQAAWQSMSTAGYPLSERFNNNNDVIDMAYWRPFGIKQITCVVEYSVSDPFGYKFSGKTLTSVPGF